jgi:uncharacterized membrane protein
VAGEVGDVRKQVWGTIGETVRRDFVAGLLVLVPIVATVVTTLWIVERIDNLVLPKVFGAIGMAGEQPPFLGIVATFLIIVLAGALTRSFVGRGALVIWERAIERVPVARSFYTMLKQFMHAIFQEGDYGSFKRVVLVEYPRRGAWSYAFVIGYSQVDMPGIPAGTVKVFIPKTPNPTTGYYVLISPDEVRDSGLSVEEAFRIIVSAGIAAPPDSEIAARLEGLRAGGTLATEQERAKRESGS